MDEAKVTLSNISSALTGIEQGSRPSSDPSRLFQITAEITSPPSYVVQMLLCGLAELDWNRGDKSAWEVNLEFKGVQFLLMDWKRTSWSISSYKATDSVRNIAEQLEKKIAAACSLLDDGLQKELRKQVDDGQFYIKNNLFQVRQPYEYFRETLKQKLTELDDAKARPLNWELDPKGDKPLVLSSGGGKVTPLSRLSEHINNTVRTERVVSHNACAMLAFFFSYTEFLFDVLFAFDEERNISYVDFRKLDWRERFKTTLPVSTDSELRGVYDRLLEMKRAVRDKVLHGYGDESALLVPFLGTGLIPMSFKVLEYNVSFSWIPIRQSDAADMVEACESFFDWVESNDRTWYALRFAEYGSDIPFDPDAVQRVREWMSSRDNFEAELAEQSARLDYLEDQY